MDRLIDRTAALPGPSWAAYLVAAIGAGVLANAAAWVDGYLPPGTFDLLLTSFAFYLVSGYAAIHNLDWAAARAWTIFRPATAMDAEAAAALEYRLTTMPAFPVLIWTVGGVLVGLVYLAGAYGQPFDLEGEPVTLVVGSALSALAFAGGGAFFYHTIHQLRLIGGLPGTIKRIDVLEQAPLHAFSSVTAVTGVFLLAGVYVNALTDPASFSNPAISATLGFAVVLAIACFVGPLYGMHQGIAAEKTRRLSDVNGRLSRGLEALHRRADDGDLADADRFHDHLSSLLAEREVIARTPTWPWDPGTLRGFATALVLPIVLWFVYRFLDQSLT
jgi:hypothetical protein